MNSIYRYFLLLLLTFNTYTSYAQDPVGKIMRDLPKILNEVFADNTHPEAKKVAEGLFSHRVPIYESYSEKKKMFVGTEKDDLYFRKEGSEDLINRLAPKEGWYWHLDNALWSPDGNNVIAKQVCEKDVPHIKLSHRDPKDVTYKKYSRSGERIPIHQLYIIEVDTRKMVPVRYNEGFPYFHVIEWDPGSNYVYIVEASRLMKEIRLLRVNVKTGRRVIVLHESSDTYLIGLDLLQGYSDQLRDRGLVTFLHDRDQFIWLSERNGFYQLYLYDYSGNLVRSLTTGVIEFIVGVDLENNWLYYLAYDDESRPYELHFFRSSLIRKEIQLVSDLPNILDAFVSKNKDSLFVLRSGLPDIMQMEAYSSEGNFLGTFWKGDVSSFEDGFFSYEYPQVLAADNNTMLETLILRPKDFDPTKKYPVIEYIYGGNFTKEVIRELFSRNLWEMQKLANNGFVVVFIDGRGTPGRGQKFRDFSYGRFGQVELEDHVEAIKQIGKDRSYMDLDRIGIIGHSWGGHFALRALLEYPDFYKVGHINAAAIDPIDFRVPIEIFMGCLPQDCPEHYAKSGISTKLSNLKASLMIVHGTADDDVPIEESYKLVKTLGAMNYSNYKFLEYQGYNHIVMRHPEWLQTMIDFFVDQLKDK